MQKQKYFYLAEIVSVTRGDSCSSVSKEDGQFPVASLEDALGMIIGFVTTTRPEMTEDMKHEQIEITATITKNEYDLDTESWNDCYSNKYEFTCVNHRWSVRENDLDKSTPLTEWVKTTNRKED